MDYFAAIVSLLILAYIYRRMIKREIPDPIKPFRAVLPFALGIFSMVIFAPYVI
ncbi:MAG: hypothetical protein IKD68_10800 [Solobacterium sp.]|nr:hypothetical protein [Solobacterium sp.]